MQIEVGNQYVTKNGNFVTVIEKEDKNNKVRYLVEKVIRYYVDSDGISKELPEESLSDETTFIDDDLLQDEE